MAGGRERPVSWLVLISSRSSRAVEALEELARVIRAGSAALMADAEAVVPAPAGQTMAAREAGGLGVARKRMGRLAGACL